MASQPSIAGVLEDLILRNKKSLKRIAKDADVPYQPLWRWMVGHTQSYDVSDAEKVYTSLTGKPFHK